MKSIFSILYVPIRPDIQEKLSVGFLLSDGETVLFDYSKTKLELVKRLFNDNSYKFLKESIYTIERSVDKIKSKFGVTGNAFKDEDKIDMGLFSAKHLEYLSRYNNNMLTFSAPKNIDVIPSIEIFQFLFKKYVDEFAFLPETIEPESTFSILRTSFYPKLSNHFNIEKEVSSIEIPKLLLPVKIDLIGKNEHEVFAQSVDLSKPTNHIKNELSNLMFLKQAIRSAKGYVISKEPDKSFQKQHSIWKNIRKSNNTFEYVELEEVNKIEEYAKEHGVLPLIK